MRKQTHKVAQKLAQGHTTRKWHGYFKVRLCGLNPSCWSSCLYCSLTLRSAFELRPQLSKGVSHVTIWRETTPEGTPGAKAPIKGMLARSRTAKLLNVAEAELARRKLKGSKSHIMKTLWSIERKVDSRGLTVESERSISKTPSRWQMKLDWTKVWMRVLVFLTVSLVRLEYLIIQSNMNLGKGYFCRYD